MEATPSRPFIPAHPALSLTVALMVTLFLFYIDEGYYDLRWMREPLNWLWFFVYAGCLFTGQVVIDRGFFKGRGGLSYQLLKRVLGLVCGVACLAAFFIVIGVINSIVRH